MAKVALHAISDWIVVNGLVVAPEKMEGIVLFRKRAYRPSRLTMGGHPISVKKAIKYLGVTLNPARTFTALPA